MELRAGGIVWARHSKDDIYWPGKIIVVSNATHDPWSNSPTTSYLVEFFLSNHSLWMADVLPYRQHRSSMTNEAFVNHGLHPSVRPNFLHAVHLADCASHDEQSIMPMQQPSPVFTQMERHETNNDFLLTTAPMFTSNTGYADPTYQPASVQATSTTNPMSSSFVLNDATLVRPRHPTAGTVSTTSDWYTQQGLLIESITPPSPPSHNDNLLEYHPPHDHQAPLHAVILVTTTSYSQPALVTALFNALATAGPPSAFRTSLVYLDQLNDFHHPPASTTVSYLICLDHFTAALQHALDVAILTSLSIHVTYYFVLVNAPSHSLVRHLYAKVMDRRSILVVHFGSTFESEEALLLCSGDRGTFDVLRSTLLRCLCPKVKYIESRGEEEAQLYSAYCISSIVQTNDVLHHFVDEQIQQSLRDSFDDDLLRSNPHVIDELFPHVPIKRNAPPHNLLDFVQATGQQLLQNPARQAAILKDLFQSGAIKTSSTPLICEYYAENIVQNE